MQRLNIGFGCWHHGDVESVVIILRILLFGHPRLPIKINPPFSVIFVAHRDFNYNSPQFKIKYRLKMASLKLQHIVITGEKVEMDLYTI